jgi:hypothetical protein
MDAISAGPQYFEHNVHGRAFQAWYYVENNAVTVVWAGRIRTGVCDDDCPPERGDELARRTNRNR